MRVFTCSSCQHQLSFESLACPNCNSLVGYLPDRRDLVVLIPDGPTKFGVAGDGRIRWRCLNAAWGCNWMLPADTGDVWCSSCQLTRGRPDATDPAAVVAWSAAEAAKRRLMFQLAELGLPVEPRSPAVPQGLAFDLVHVPGASGVTGHDRGLITLDLSEADDQRRDELRRRFGEAFRTLIGHLRHEVGHYYFDRLIRGDNLTHFRFLFGDERADYPGALDEHYRSMGSGADEPDLVSHVTAYATAHPLEDWAETFAHYLHIRDAYQTADSHGLDIVDKDPDGRTSTRGQVGEAESFSSILARWLPIADTINDIADGLGSSRPYPFVLSPAVVTKLEFVHSRVAANSDREGSYATS